MGIVIVCFQVCEDKNFEINVTLSRRFPAWSKSQGKNVNTLRTRRAFNMKSIFLKKERAFIEVNTMSEGPTLTFLTKFKW